MLGGGVNAALISFLRLVGLLRLLIRPRQHTESIAFIVRNRQVTFQSFNHLCRLPYLLILLGEAKENAAVDGIAYQHLLEDVDS